MESQASASAIHSSEDPGGKMSPNRTKLLDTRGFRDVEAVVYGGQSCAMLHPADRTAAQLGMDAETHNVARNQTRVRTAGFAGISPSNSWAGNLLQPVVRRFLRDNYIVNVALAKPRRRDA